MPKVIVSGVSKHAMLQAVPRINERLEKELNIPEEWVETELLSCEFFSSKGVVEHCPMIDIYWFNRPQDVCNAAAAIYADELHAEGYDRVILQFIETARNLWYDLK